MITWLFIGAGFLLSLGFASFKYKTWAVQEPPKPPELPATPSLPIEPPKPLVMPKTVELYQLSKSLLGTHLGKDTSVPWMVNCANACSDLLIRFGISGLGSKGIAGTANLLKFLETTSQFEEVFEYTTGAVVISATGTGNGKIRGHVGICGNFVIMSNNSEAGRWDDQWNWERWHDYYTEYGGIPSRFFVPV